MTDIQVPSLASLMAEVAEVNRANGWYDKEVSFRTACALMHSEVSEALEAWRRWDLADMTGECHHESAGDLAHKPEGVPSEFADLYIRLLDYSYRFEVDLDHEVARQALSGARGWGVSGEFADDMDILHCLIAKASEWYRADHGYWPREFAKILMFLHKLCAAYGVDLQAEYQRKLAYNKTRGYRHGGRAV